MARAVQTAIDSLNFFVESRNAGNIINAVTTATGGVTSPDQINTAQHGALFFVAFASVTVTACTLALNINAKDPAAGTYYPWARVSIDAVSVLTTQNFMALMYIGAASTPAAINGSNMGVSFTENMQIIPLPVPPVFQVVSSLTISNTTATMSGTVSYTVDYSKVM